jgi:ribosomal protein S18 acetylase RimI-like enzyme
MIAHKKEILKLAKALFTTAEWPHIECYLETCLPDYSKTLIINNELAAFVIVNETKAGHAFISYCGVHPSHQGKGYGSKLLKETLAGIFQVDYIATRLYVDTWNGDAFRLYTRLGFQTIGSEVVAGSPCDLLELTCREWKNRNHEYNGSRT